MKQVGNAVLKALQTEFESENSELEREVMIFVAKSNPGNLRRWTTNYVNKRLLELLTDKMFEDYTECPCVTSEFFDAKKNLEALGLWK